MKQLLDGRWKLPAQVIQLRALKAQGLSYRQIARRAGISHALVGRRLKVRQ